MNQRVIVIVAALLVISIVLYSLMKPSNTSEEEYYSDFLPPVHTSLAGQPSLGEFSNDTKLVGTPSLDEFVGRGVRENFRGGFGGGRGGRGGFRGGFGGRGGRGGWGGGYHGRPYRYGGWRGYGGGWGYPYYYMPWYDYYSWDAPDMTLANPLWCWRRVAREDIGMPAQFGSRKDWIDWGRAKGMTRMLFPKGEHPPSYVLIESTTGCFLNHNDNISGFDFVTLN